MEAYYYPYPETVRRVVLVYLDQCFRGRSEDWKREFLWTVLKTHSRSFGHAPDVAILEGASAKMRDKYPYREFKPLPVYRMSEEEATRLFEQLRNEICRRKN